jgi:hypothetical protein
LGLALLLLAGSVWPLLAWPILLPIYAIAPGVGALLGWPVLLPILLPIHAVGPKFEVLLDAAWLFPHTVPIYVSNILDRGQATATIIDVTYSISIGGVRYAPLVRTACTARKIVGVGYGGLQFFDKFPTASGGELIAQAGDATVVLDQSSQLCDRLRNLKLGPLGDVAVRIYVVRGDADKTQVYELPYRGGTVAIDDIVLQPPEIVRIDKAPAKEVIGLDALWPRRRSSELTGYDLIPLIEAYRHLPAGENSCIARIYATVDPITMTSRRSSTDYPDYIPAMLRPTYCRLVLWWRIPRPARSRLEPLAG